ncbi:MAG: hypothetical protein RMK99_06135 [Anaerolineales bacterium]|nr:hypothetical protein [Anaerolineales bacterium]
MASASDEQFQAVQQALERLEAAGIAYAVTGSWVVSSYGLLRNTHDLDLVVSLTEADVARIVAAFPWPRYYADDVAIAEAVARQSFFNILDVEASLKIDFWPLKTDDYSQEQFRRRRRGHMAERSVWLLTPEDIVLSKLLWFKMSESERQWRDIESVWQLKRDELDLDYLRRWAARLSVADLLNRVTES